MEYIDKTGLTHLKDTIRQETKTEIEKATNKALPINFYKFSTKDEMYATVANDGDIGIFCGEVEEGVSQNTQFKNIIIKDSIFVYGTLPEEATNYYFYNIMNQKQVEVIISVDEIKIIVHKIRATDIEKTFIYQRDGILKDEYILKSGEPEEISFSSGIFFQTYNNVNEWNSVLFYILVCKLKKVEMYIHNEDTRYDSGWEKIVTLDNSYMTEGMVKYLIKQALDNNS